MSYLIFDPWHFYKIKCFVPKSKQEGGGTRIRWKFWIHLVSGDPHDGFFINSKKKWGNPLQMDIAPDDINCYLPIDAPNHHKLMHASFINFKKTNINRKNIVEAEIIFNTMPTPLAHKILEFLKANERHIPKGRMKIMEDELKKYL